MVEEKRMNTTLRMTPELADLLTRTAAHIHATETAIVLAAATGIRNGRNVIQLDLGKCMTKAGSIRKSYRMELPCPQGEFRRVLALRCYEELKKPVRRYRPNIPPGVEYIVEESGE